MNSKWITAVVIIFGLLTVFFIFGWSTVLKSTLIFSCVVLIGCVLLQSGKGGGLAAIGGLADQSAMGTQTGGILAKITYLVGAVFIVATLFLTKLTLNSIHGTDSLRTEMSTSLQHDHEGVVDEHAGHNHAPGEHVDHAQASVGEVVEEAKSVGMKAVDVASEGLKSIETKVESITEEVKND
ncbi:MAG: preprotein translocase subunit SecG [Candidatus Scalindua sp.]|jgi:protein translocase SecG subunit|nr:preprotein translocase subunit SecG [Candidatus Scalindua sp.]MBT5306350.1 preprotein translocase subunit SecG [Candidatus Scalindua sp.]MBT6046287.1 preprotein translocase subunit SecG [Candidatus Scalindua sp.]MBT6226641.1 preprotein translocase subunit SecG [Candidatus Scalindua sp.]MBT6564190.1 preprotein translocase subunit SecG [Candidatus Scalindua sp.]